MMKRVSLSHLKFTLIGRSGNRDSEHATTNANGDLRDDEIYSDEGEENPQNVNKMCSASKSKRNIIKTLRWKWRKKRGSSGIHDSPESPPSDDFGNISQVSGTLRGFVPKKLRSKIPKSGAKRVVCPATPPVQCAKQNQDVTIEHESDILTGIPTQAFSHHENLSVDAFPLPNCNPGRLSQHENPRTANLTRELFKLSRCGWYWGPVTRSEAEEKLCDQPDGAFLVRDSSDDRHLLSISFRSFGRTLHTRIEHCNGMFSFYAHPEPEGHASIVDLIEQSIRYSQSGVFCYSRGRTPGSPSYPVRLTKPMSRFNQVRTLQYLCRFIIRQYTRFDHIQKLPLPGPIKGYLEEGHY